MRALRGRATRLNDSHTRPHAHAHMRVHLQKDVNCTGMEERKGGILEVRHEKRLQLTNLQVMRRGNQCLCACVCVHFCDQLPGSEVSRSCSSKMQQTLPLLVPGPPLCRRTPSARTYVQLYWLI